jgi:hypothetical protein
MFLLILGIPACVKYDLEIQNKTDEVLDIYIDGYYEGSVAPNNYLSIRNLSLGDHEVEAFDLDGRLVADDMIYLDEDSKWIIYD